ncbi:MAG: phage portal protein [Clostridia bacterium]|nr:phage portal protein [Clostridia bacterium]
MGLISIGRKQIFTDADEITRENVVDVISDVMPVHTENSKDITYLYKYYKGYQPILSRTKDVRPEICNKVVVNHANEIVSFKTGYLCGEPILYVSRSEDENLSGVISTLNGFMGAEGKEERDKELIEWDMICGTAYRMILPDSGMADESPFEIYTLDPRQAFVIYSNKIGHKPMAGVYVIETKDATVTSVYTENAYYEYHSGDLQPRKVLPYTLGIIPIIEYPANTARMGAFESVLDLLDEINLVQSNRVDGLEQAVQNLMVATNVDFEEGVTSDKIRQSGLICLKSTDSLKADIELLDEAVDQTAAQTLIDDLYDRVLTITGMPNRNGGSSTSDTGTAVVYRDGWSAAETRAKDSEAIYKESEYTALKLVLKICGNLKGMKASISDIAIKFTRRNYENISTKASVLTTMLASEKIAPRLAFVSCGMFSDPEAAYQESAAYAERQEEKAQEKAEETANGVSGDSDEEVSDDV